MSTYVSDAAAWLPTLAVLDRLSCCIVCAVLSGCQRQPGDDASAGPADSPRRVTVLLNWFPEVEHGGFYAAEVHGYFAEEGLDVEIQPGGPGAPVIQQVASGRCDFAVANADQVLLGRDQGAPVVAVMAAMQDSPHCIMVHASSGIDSLLQAPRSDPGGWVWQAVRAVLVAQTR